MYLYYLFIYLFHDIAVNMLTPVLFFFDKHTRRSKLNSLLSNYLGPRLNYEQHYLLKIFNKKVIIRRRHNGIVILQPHLYVT